MSEPVDLAQVQLAKVARALVTRIARMYAGGQPADWVEEKAAIVVEMLNARNAFLNEPLHLKIFESIPEAQRQAIVNETYRWCTSHLAEQQQIVLDAAARLLKP